MGSFATQPLKVVCRDMDEIRSFLQTCQYVSDHEQFGLRDTGWRPKNSSEPGVATVTISRYGPGDSFLVLGITLVL